MSFLLTRPPRPVPGTRERSTSRSRATRRTRGEERTFPLRTPSSGPLRSPPSGAPRALFGGVSGGVAGVGSASTLRVARSTAGGRAVAASSPSSTATTLFTATVSFSFTRILLRTPAAGDGISASTLSVEISRSGSSRSTYSPTFLSHLTTVPSAMLSPIWGMMTLVGIFTSLNQLKVESPKLKKSKVKSRTPSVELSTFFDPFE